MATFVRVGDKTKAIIRKQGFPTHAQGREQGIRVNSREF